MELSVPELFGVCSSALFDALTQLDNNRYGAFGRDAGGIQRTNGVHALNSLVDTEGGANTIGICSVILSLLPNPSDQRFHPQQQQRQ